MVFTHGSNVVHHKGGSGDCTTRPYRHICASSSACSGDDGPERLAALELPPATLRFFYDEPFPELADPLPQGLLSRIASERWLIGPGFCSSLGLAEQLDRCVESFSECRFEPFRFHVVPSVDRPSHMRRAHPSWYPPGLRPTHIGTYALAVGVVEKPPDPGTPLPCAGCVRPGVQF